MITITVIRRYMSVCGNCSVELCENVRCRWHWMSISCGPNRHRLRRLNAVCLSNPRVPWAPDCPSSQSVCTDVPSRAAESMASPVCRRTAPNNPSFLGCFSNYPSASSINKLGREHVWAHNRTVFNYEHSSRSVNIPVCKRDLDSPHCWQEVSWDILHVVFVADPRHWTVPSTLL